MNKKSSIIVKEVCEKKSCVSDFEAIIQTNAPIKEIYEIRHQILKPKVLLGKNAIALFGKILIKTYSISNENHELYLTEQIANYKGFIIGEFKFCDLTPGITVNSRLEGIFSEMMEGKRVRITGVISTELLFTLEKEIEKDIFEDPRENNHKDLAVTRHQMDEGMSNYTVYSFADNAEDDCKVGDEVITEVTSNSNQEFTIILD